MNSNNLISGLGLAILSSMLFACDGRGVEGPIEGPVDFNSPAAAVVREAACAASYDTGARKGAAAEAVNASTLWSVSPYMVLVPSAGEGHVRLNVDAPHFDWLLYTTSDFAIDNIDGPDIEFNGAVKECPELDLVEYGVHHPELTSWSLVLEGEGLARAHFYAGLAPTEHSDLSQAGHAGHSLNGEAHVPNHGDH
jgi:hypothetical protein